MTSIGTNRNEGKAQTYRITIPFGHLVLVVDEKGERWVPLAHLSELISVPMGGLLAKVDKARYWGYQNLDVPCVAWRLCLPMEKVTSLLNTIKERQVPSAKWQVFRWLQSNAHKVLYGFQVPEPERPLIVEEPERPVEIQKVAEPTPIIQSPVTETGLQTFSFGSAPVRVVMREGEPWFVASDVLKILEVDRTSLERLDDDEKGVDSIHTPGGTQSATVLTEPGLYSLILGSRKPEAKAFKRWITHEVIPAIRKTGSYGVQTFHVPQTLREALLLAADQQATIEAHQATISTLTPKAQFTDRVTASKDSISIREFAKVLGDTGQNRFYQWLRLKGYLTLNGTEPYQRWVDQGIFVVIEKAFEDVHGLDRVGRKTLITGKGQVRLQGEWDQERQGGQAS